MAQQEKDTRIVLKGEKARAKLLEGAKAVYDGVSTTYGPKGRNVLIEKPFGRPLMTRDGVTVAKDIYFKDRAKNMGAQYVNEAAEITNKISGDGTSATVGLTYLLLEGGQKSIAAGMHPMEVKDMLVKDSFTLLKALKKLSKPAKISQLKEVATVSSGSSIYGDLIGGAIERAGNEGGILTERAFVEDVTREYIDGYYLQNGFQALQSGKKELIDPFVIVSAKRLTSGVDAFELMTKTAKSKGVQPGEIPKFLFVGNFEDACYQSIVENINRGTIDAVIIKTPPQFGAMGTQLLEDIAIYAKCRIIGESDNVRNFTDGNIGTVDKVVATQNYSTLFADNKTENIEVRVQEIKDRLKDETSDAIAEKLRERISSFENKVALFKIGGSTDSEKEEKEFRIEDAIQATRAAFREGIVAGGGVTWIELSKLDISPTYKTALQALFSKLLTNANLPEQVYLQKVLDAPKGFGINLRDTGELVDMFKVGVLDPTLVCEQVIKNATSNAALLLTTDKVIIFEDMKVEK